MQYTMLLCCNSESKGHTGNNQQQQQFCTSVHCGYKQQLIYTLFDHYLVGHILIAYSTSKFVLQTHDYYTKCIRTQDDAQRERELICDQQRASTHAAIYQPLLREAAARSKTPHVMIYDDIRNSKQNILSTCDSDCCISCPVTHGSHVQACTTRPQERPDNFDSKNVKVVVTVNGGYVLSLKAWSASC